MGEMAIFLCDKTGHMAQPWAEAGYTCYCVDIQHEKGEHREGNVIFVGADIHRWMPPLGSRVAFLAAFPPCTHLAVSGARWFKGKGLYALADSIALFARCADLAEASGAPYLIENPVSTISSYWRKPDHTFHPHMFTGHAPEDNYTKKTCLWTGGGFVMPAAYEDPSLGAPDNRIHFASPGDDRADFRSATPRGFARAVFLANAPAALRSAPTQQLSERVETLFDAIAHGDPAHREWLKRAVSCHFSGQPVPEPLDQHGVIS